MTKITTLLLVTCYMTLQVATAQQIVLDSAKLCSTVGTAQVTTAGKSHHSFSSAKIPVFFQLIEGRTGAGRVPDTAIRKQMQMLNDAFAGVFVFELYGVRRVVNPNWFVDDPTKSDSKKSAYTSAMSVEPGRVLNVYVLDLEPAGLAGMGVLPGSANTGKPTDGVYLDYKVLPGMGGLYNWSSDSGDWLVHEVGHYFGLLHTFQGVDNNICPRTPLDPLTQGDLIADTDVHRRPSIHQIPDCSFRQGCGGRGSIEPVDNYMNYSADDCRNTFTPGQRDRLRQQTATFRSRMIQSTEPIAIKSDLRVNKGEELQLLGGEFRFSYGKRIVNFGTLKVSNSTLTSGSAWKGIYSGSNSTTEITNSVIDEVGGGAGTAAVKAYRAKVDIYNSEVETLSGGAIFGVYATGYSDVKIRNTDISTASGPAVEAYGGGASVFVYGSTLHSTTSSPVVRASGGGLVMFWPGPTAPYVGRNFVYGKSIEANYNGYVNAGSAQRTTSQNSFCTPLTLRARNGGSIAARYNYWSAQPIKINDGGTISIHPSLGSPNCSGASSSSEVAVAQEMLFEQLSESDEARLMQLYSSDVERFQREVLGFLGSDDPSMRLLAGTLAIESLRTRRDSEIESRLRSIMQVGEQRDGTLLRRLAAFYVDDGNRLVGSQLAKHVFDNVRNMQEKERAILLSQLDSGGPAKTDSGSLLESPLAEIAAAELTERMDAPVVSAQLNDHGRLRESRSELQGLIQTSAHPNPFNPTTMISFSVPAGQEIKLAVFDAAGRMVESLASGYRDAGTHSVLFDATGLSSGLYFYRLESSGGATGKPIVLLK